MGSFCDLTLAMSVSAFLVVIDVYWARCVRAGKIILVAHAINNR